MKCVGDFKFKGLTKRDGGVFTNEKGQEIPYKESYALKVDELTENGIYERIFKIASDSELLKEFEGIEPYTDIVIEFDVNIFGNRITVVPVAVSN